MGEYDQIVEAVRTAMSRRDERRNILARRIADVATAAMDAARVTEVDCGDAGVVAVHTMTAMCSQGGSGSGWPTYEHSEDHLALDLRATGVRSLGDVPDLTYHDGHNMQHQLGATRDDETGTAVRPATVAQLRAVARELPAVVARILAAAKATADTEAEEADATTATL